MISRPFSIILVMTGLISVSNKTRSPIAMASPLHGLERDPAAERQSAA